MEQKLTDEDQRLLALVQEKVFSNLRPGFDNIPMWATRQLPAETTEAELLELIARLNAELNKGLAQPDIRGKLEKIGVDVDPQTPEQMAAFMKEERERWGRVIRENGVKAE